jgi:hypothetical protein
MMTTRDELHEAARKVAKQKQVVDNLGLVNVYGMEPERKADLDARYRIETDLLHRFDGEYRAKLNAFVPEKE